MNINARLQAMHDLEVALVNWRFVTGKQRPIGVLLIAFEYDGVDMQYLGRVEIPDAQLREIMRVAADKIAAGDFDIDRDAGVPW